MTTPENFERCEGRWRYDSSVQCCLQKGHEDPCRYKCSGPSCPGLIWPASVIPHPATCAAQYVRMEDFRKPDGLLDWKAYEKAQVENGEICALCHALASFRRPTTGKPFICGSCSALDEDAKDVHHEKYVRCPKCKKTFEPERLVSDNAGDFDEFLSEGDHVATCAECETDFTFKTRISYEFVSPALLERKSIEISGPPIERTGPVTITAFHPFYCTIHGPIDGPKCPSCCPSCGGTGRDPGSDNVNWRPCSECSGSGKAVQR